MQLAALSLEHFLFHKRLRCIYALVPKTGTTSIKHWFVATGAVDGKLSVQGNVHDLLRATCSLEQMPRVQAADLLADPAVFKFAFVRNPWTRLVSGYLDKVVGAAPPAIALVRSKLQGTLWGRGQWLLHRVSRRVESLLQRGLTFREFVEVVCATRPEELNRHFRPQASILQNVPLDFVGHMESFAVDFRAVLQRLEETIQPRVEHKQRYQPISTNELAADWSAAKLRQAPEFPHWQRFYSPDIEQRVAQFFAADFAAFGYPPHLTSLKQAA